MKSTPSTSDANPASNFPTLIYGTASPISLAGHSMLKSATNITAASIKSYTSEVSTTLQAIAMLEANGFDILDIGPLLISIAGTKETYERAFQISLASTEYPMVNDFQQKISVTIFHAVGDETGIISTKGTPFEGIIEDIAIERPRYFHQPDPIPRLLVSDVLRVPDDLALLLNATKAHRLGYTGMGTKVAIVDSGFFLHPFFSERGYRISPVVLSPGAEYPDVDDIGHGTAMAANVLSIAPDTQIIPIKMARAGRSAIVNSVCAFNTALALQPDVILCCWGFDLENPPLSAADQALAASISAAVAANHIVVFSAGNGQWSFPGQHPEVISAGGAYPLKDGGWEVSDFCSAFVSKIYPGRPVPDICGVVGNGPDGDLLLLPTQPASLIDKSRLPKASEASPEVSEDGWAIFSGTSAAAAQISGAAAVLRQAHPDLSPSHAKQLLQACAKDVERGQSHPRFRQEATAGPDLATGQGVVDVHGALLKCRVWSITPKPMLI
jgi:hypothetical protein